MKFVRAIWKLLVGVKDALVLLLLILYILFRVFRKKQP